MLSPISLYAKFKVRGVKIQYIIIYRKLSSKFNIGEATVSQHGPELLFSIGLIFSEISGFPDVGSFHNVLLKHRPLTLRPLPAGARELSDFQYFLSPEGRGLESL